MLAVNGGYLPRDWIAISSVCYRSACMQYKMHYDGFTWSIRDSDTIVAEAASVARHPATIFQGQWRVRNRATGRMEDSSLLFHHDRIKSSPQHPLTMEDLGVDFFARRTGTKIGWYGDPVSYTVHHSGANGNDGGCAGKRFCPICMRSFSANNFVSQHMRLQHPESARPGSPVLEAIFIDEV